LYRALTVATRIAFAVLIPVAAAQTRGVFVTPIPNVPLLAVVNTQSSQIQKDGTTLNRKTLSAIARDGHGRIFNERRPVIPVSETATPPILSIPYLRPADQDEYLHRSPEPGCVAKYAQPAAVVCTA
jgi:hypothetical protein